MHGTRRVRTTAPLAVSINWSSASSIIGQHGDMDARCIIGSELHISTTRWHLVRGAAASMEAARGRGRQHGQARRRCATQLVGGFEACTRASDSGCHEFELVDIAPSCRCLCQRGCRVANRICTSGSTSIVATRQRPRGVSIELARD